MCWAWNGKRERKRGAHVRAAMTRRQTGCRASRRRSVQTAPAAVASWLTQRRGRATGKAGSPCSLASAPASSGGFEALLLPVLPSLQLILSGADGRWSVVGPVPEPCLMSTVGASRHHRLKGAARPASIQNAALQLSAAARHEVSLPAELPARGSEKTPPVATSFFPLSCSPDPIAPPRRYPRATPVGIVR